MSNYKDRIIRAAKLDANLYEEVEADKGALIQAMGVVVLSSIAAGLGSLTLGGINGLIFGAVSALIGWAIWAYLAYFIGTRFLATPQTHADYGELLRTTGFAAAPGLIRILGIIPGLAGIVFQVAGIWMLVTMVIAVRQALDYQSTWRAVGVCIIGWIVQALVFWLFISLIS